jgi:hypothetical protein
MLIDLSKDEVDGLIVALYDAQGTLLPVMLPGSLEAMRIYNKWMNLIARLQKLEE